MGNLKLKLLEGESIIDRWDMKKGEATLYNRSDGTQGLCIACPQCGQVATGSHIWHPETQSLTPSLVCGADGCNYHGFLTNGVFTEVNKGMASEH